MGAESSILRYLPHILVTASLLIVIASLINGGPSDPQTQTVAELSVQGSPAPIVVPTPSQDISVAKIIQPESHYIEALNTAIVDDNLIEKETTAARWQSIKVQPGDNMALIFQRKRLPASVVHDIMSLGEKTTILERLKPDQQLRLLIENNEFVALQYDLDLNTTLDIRKSGDDYSTDIIGHTLQVKTIAASGIIKDSLFLSAKDAGLSDNIIMQMINLYGWDIDFALEVRQGDQFRILYEEQYKDGKKVRDGAILATEFINQGKSFKLVRYTHADGRSDYYTENGHSMRKTFIRTPIKFNRISSHFNPRRKHPILNQIRSHRGVDYAAPTGTPIKATGDGIIKLAARKSNYGKTIIIQHSSQYTTLYGHLSRYAKGIKKGMPVKQGQIIAYVGMTGLATGPHLHYEFRVNGIYKNPLTVELPRARAIHADIIVNFQKHTEPLLAQLNNIGNKTVSNDKPLTVTPTVIALNENRKTSSQTN